MTPTPDTGNETATDSGCPGCGHVPTSVSACSMAAVKAVPQRNLEGRDRLRGPPPAPSAFTAVSFVRDELASEAEHSDAENTTSVTPRRDC